MAAERFQEGSNPSFKISFGEWPGPSNIIGDVHVEIGSIHSQELHEQIQGAALDTGGSILRKQGENHWADFFDQSSAERFIERADLLFKEDEMARKYDEIGMSGTPLFLLKPIRHEWTDKDGQIKSETLSSISIDGHGLSSIMLYSGMDEADRGISPTPLVSLPLGDQKQVLSELSECLEHWKGSNQQVEPSEVFRTKASAFLNIDEENSKMLSQMADFRDVTNIELEVKDGHPYFDGNLDLHQSKIEKLPDNLEVDGELDLHKTSINSLPANLVVNGDLDLSETNIESIPEDLKVKGELSLPARRMGSKVSEQYVFSPDYLGRVYKRRDGYLDICRIKREWNNLTSNDFKTNHFGLFFPLMQQYADFKRNYPNVVPLFNIGAWYETYQADAERVGKALRLPVQESVCRLGPDDKHAKVITIPPQGYWISQLKVNRIPFAILEDMNRGKNIDSSEGSDLSQGHVREQSQEQDNEQRRNGGIRR